MYIPNTHRIPSIKRGNVRATQRWGAVAKQLLPWKSTKYYLLGCVCVCVCVCSCGYTGAGLCLRACSLHNPACNAPSYCHLWPLWLHQILRHYLINGTIFGKKLWNTKCVFWLSTQLLFKTFLVLRRIQRGMSKRLHVKYPLFLSNFNETCIFSTYFRRKLKYQVSSKSVQWVPTCSMRTDRQIW
jgi:hypothetical protein